MSADELPTEILQHIFRHLTGFDVIQCRAVCTRWRDAVDTLSDAQWQQICFNEPLRRNYAKLRARHGLSWYDTYRAYHSWSQIGSAELTIQKLCDNAEFLIVRPHGIVGCFNRTKESDDQKDRSLGFCDTIVYYDTKTGKECDRQQVDFYFRPRLFTENEHLQVFVLKDRRICILVKETKQKYFVGSLDALCEITLIGKSVYFKNKVDQIIYHSKLNDHNTISTKKLEAFEDNHDRFEDIIMTFIKLHNSLYFLTCSEYSSRVEVYKYDKEHADFECLGDMRCDDEYFFCLLEDEGFDWRSPAIYTWIRETSSLTPKGSAFYANDVIILSSTNKGKAINIHSFPNFIPDLKVLNMYLKRKPLRKLELDNNMIKSIQGHDILKFLNQVDVIETSNSHKILAIMSKALFVFDLKPSDKNDESDQKIIKKPRLQKPKAVLAKKKGIKRALNK